MTNKTKIFFLLTLLSMISVVSFGQTKELSAAIKKGKNTQMRYVAEFASVKPDKELSIRDWCANKGYKVIYVEKQKIEKSRGTYRIYLKSVEFMEVPDYYYAQAMGAESSLKLIENYLSVYSSEKRADDVKERLLEKIQTFSRMKEYSRKQPDMKKAFDNKAYLMAMNGDILLKKDYVEKFPTGQGVTGFKQDIESDRLQKNAEAREAARLQKIQDEKAYQERIKREEEDRKRRAIEEKRKREAEAQAEANRVRRIKNAGIGSRLCYSQDWYRNNHILGFVYGKDEWTMRIICFVERREGDRIQIRVGSVESSNRYESSRPDIDGVKVSKGDIVWINPENDSRWRVCN